MKWTSRKLWFATVSLIGATALLVSGFVNEGTWQGVFMATVGAYLASQGVVDYAEKKSA